MAYGCVNEKDLLALHLGGRPDVTYKIHFKDDDKILLDHSPTIDIEVAIKKLERAVNMLKMEYGVK